MDEFLGPSIFGLRRYRKDWVELFRSAAASRHAWRGTVRDSIVAGKIRHDHRRSKYKYLRQFFASVFPGKLDFI
ncbi:unnamed protein product [Dibothriocephalus latus]|uniref:Uncharacterized protein n=1 Tax=Dibothriocephalus latus TaxID=60516 RepID=A0A3P7M709_DIBLA|nr:unnamed protein product [Dibothriocephalus latus]